jgi:hypothetical protein
MKHMVEKTTIYLLLWTHSPRWTTHTSLRRRPWWWRRPLAGILLSARVPGRAPGSSRSCFDDGGGLEYVSGKSNPSIRFFPSRGLYRQRGIVRRWTRGPHHGWVRPGAGPHPPCGVAGLLPPSISSSVFAKLR